MKTTFILAFILLLLSFHSNAQQTIDKLNANQLKLPKESSNKALILDGAGQVKSSTTISDTELGYLEGLSDTLVNLLGGKENTITPGTSSQYYRGDKTFQTLDKSAVGLSNVDNTSDANKPISSATQTALNAKADDSVVVKLTGNQSISGTKTLTGKLIASSTLNGSIPCPVMTQVQRDLFVAAQGDCVYNTTSLQLNIYDGSVWKSAGGSGGISLWLTGTVYAVNDVVIQSDKIYRALIAHTSGTFATDLSAGRWTEVSASPSTPYSLANGGTNKALTAVNGGIVWVDADSFEILTAGVLGQVLQSNGAGAPSWVNKSISAKAENGSSVTAEELQVSNNQLTQVDTNKHLIESGNNNLLVNPSFEHSTFSTGWTNSAGTFTEETVVEIHGKKAAKLVLSSQTMSLSQSSTLYAAQFADGVQGLASVRVKSDIALKVCSIQAGTVSTTNCVDVQANNKWGLYKVPFILGANSNGISIASTGAVSGTVYIDDAFVGAASLTQNMNACNDVSCETEFSARQSAGTVSQENLDWIDGSCTGSSASRTCNFKAGVFTVAPNCSVTSAVTDNVYTSMSVTSTSVTVRSGATNNVTYDYAWNIICQKQGADFTAAKQLSNGNTYSSTNADTDWASCGLTGASFTGFGSAVPTPNLQCKRQGGDLLMKGTFTAGTTPTAVEARMALPTWNGVQLVSAGSSVIPSIQTVGVGGRNDASVGHAVLIEPSVSYVTFSQYADGVRFFLTKQNGSIIASTGTIHSFTARIPIEGWQNSNIIIGQFNGLESCSSTLECTDTFSAKVSAAGNVSDENITSFINGNCSWASGVVTCGFTTGVFTVAPNCSLTPANTTGQRMNITSITASQFVASDRANDGTANTASDFHVICQKQGVDYIGKTAKAVASDQNLRTPGVTNGKICSFIVSGSSTLTRAACTSSPCFVLNQNGGCVSSVTRTSPGLYLVNFASNYWSSSGSYTCSKSLTNWQTGGSGVAYDASEQTVSSKNIQVNNTAGVTDGSFEMVCHGY